MKVEVVVDEEQVVRQAILDDWRRLNDDIRTMKAVKKTRRLEDHEKIDMKDWKRFRKAIKVMIGYYYTSAEAQEIISKKGSYYED